MTADIIKFPKAKKPRPLVVLDAERIERLRVEREALGLGPSARSVAIVDPMMSVCAIASLFTGEA